MTNVGLDYISLGRTMTTLSGGESQRIRLASQLGSGLVGVTYVLDEPSIGLHPRDNERLIATLRSLQGRGNTVLVVEHDEATIREADHIIELGPGSGAHGGDMVYHGSFENLIKHSETLTAKYMRGDLSVPIPDERREPKGWLTLRGVTTNNLKDIDCPIPLGTLTCVTGVSGSGKSSLVVDTLYKHLALAQGIRVDQPGSIRGIDGVEAIERIVAIDQTPIGRTPRSNPATYTKIFDEIRNIFAMTPDARKRGYQPGRFSFNVKLAELARYLDALGLAAGEGGGGLSQTDVVEPHIFQYGKAAFEYRIIGEELAGLTYGHVQHFRDVQPPIADFEGFVIVALAPAHVAGDVHVGQEVHFHADLTVAAARLAASAHEDRKSVV